MAPSFVRTLWCVCFLGDDRTLITSRVLSHQYLVSYRDTGMSSDISVVYRLLLILLLFEAQLNILWIHEVRRELFLSSFTTFNTPFGRYRFTRLPIGVNSAQDVFQKEIDLTYEGLPGVAAIVDDILVYGKNQEDHDAKLEAVLRKIPVLVYRVWPWSLSSSWWWMMHGLSRASLLWCNGCSGVKFSNPVKQIPSLEYSIGLLHRITASDYASDYRIGLPHRITHRITASDYRIGLPHRITALDYHWFASFEMATKQVHPMDFTGNIS